MDSRHLSTLPLDTLILRAQGCTEQTCPHHGEFNREIARRRLTGDKR